MDRRPKLYRLLRDEESPMVDGIKSKRPLAEDTPLMHIRNGSNRSSQWISTSKSLSAIDKFIKLKRRKDGMFTECRVVEIDEQMLIYYSDECKKMLFKIRNTVGGMTGYGRPPLDTLFKPHSEQITGEILDFTNPTIMNKYIPRNPTRPMINDRARGYATKYCEVLVERFIPPECCVCVINR